MWGCTLRVLVKLVKLRRGSIKRAPGYANPGLQNTLNKVMAETFRKQQLNVVDNMVNMSVFGFTGKVSVDISNFSPHFYHIQVWWSLISPAAAALASLLCFRHMDRRIKLYLISVSWDLPCGQRETVPTSPPGNRNITYWWWWWLLVSLENVRAELIISEHIWHKL